MSVQYKYYYFHVRGRGDFIRYIMQYANVPYEEITIESKDWWGEMKQKMPMGVVPVLELPDGHQLSQSLAIGRYLASKHGLLSADAFENAWGDQLVSAIEDVYFPYYRPYVFATREKDGKKQKEAWEEMKTKAIIPLFEKFEKFLAGKTWFCGSKILWVDLVIAEFVDRIEVIFEKGIVQPKYPKLYAHMKRVHELPAIKKYTEKRPNYNL